LGVDLFCCLAVVFPCCSGWEICEILGGGFLGGVWNWLDWECSLATPTTLPQRDPTVLSESLPLSEYELSLATTSASWHSSLVSLSSFSSLSESSPPWEFLVPLSELLSLTLLTAALSLRRSFPRPGFLVSDSVDEPSWLLEALPRWLELSRSFNASDALKTFLLEDVAEIT
jgi:hypothetical protein